MHNLLTESLLPVVVGGRPERMTLPAVLAQLSAGDVEDFPGLATHQRQAWFHFLVQLAAIAAARAGQPDLPTARLAWAERLAALAAEHSETAWSLVVPDASRPALFQPPTARLQDMKPAAFTPDAIDVLQTAKNHDVKSFRLGEPEPYHWFYALLTLQTMQGYSGRGHLGIARMNGGYGSRVLVELTPSMAWGERFRRGVGVALAKREAVLIDPFGRNGLALLWLEPWDQETSFGLGELDPCFIEICQRVRLRTSPDGQIVALFRTSEVERVAAKPRKGALGDPFVPVSRDGAALTVVGANGFGYDLVSRLLTDEKFVLPASLEKRAGDAPGDMLLHLSVLVRGQGRTEGLHERVLPVGPVVRRMIMHENGRRALNEIAGEMIVTVSEGPKFALKTGILTLLQAPPPGGRVDFRSPEADEWLGRLDRRIDEAFFRWLERMAGASGDEGRDEVKREWQQELRDIAGDLFAEALNLLPSPSARRERARALAEMSFRGILRKKLPMVHDGGAEEAA